MEPQEPRPHHPRASSLAVHEDLARLLAEGRRVAVATIVRARGSHPREVGSKMLVVEEGGACHTVGGGPLEASIIADCRAALSGQGSGLHRYDLTESGENSVGMTCGGSDEAFIDVEEPPQRLIIFGAGHVGRAVAQVAHVAGLALTIVDDRAEWLAPEAFPPGTALHRCGRDYGADLARVAPSSLCVVMTRCHETDVTVLEALSRVGPRHVGFMGSRRKVARAWSVLESRGVSRVFLDSVRAPIGLKLGAETPGEIGVAVVAEIVELLRGAPVVSRVIA